jgi:exodeoxyribonuclease V alpha subunit
MDMLSVQGTVERITYRNEDSLYTVARVACEERGPAGRRRQTITVVGTFPFISVGETLLMKGEWTYHPEYGSQFRVESYESIVPATVKGIEKYLGSGLIKGIGPVTAKKLVAHFGTKTLDVIEHEPERLTEVEGIGEKKAEAITQAFEEQKEIRRVMVFLADHGVTPGLAIKIFRHYGNASIQAVRENPYRLADEIHGVGFKTADKIAAELGIEPVSQERITAGIVYVLNELASDGHVYYPEDALIKEVASVLEVEEALVKDAIPVLEERGSIVREMIQGQTAVYLAYLYRAERCSKGGRGEGCQKLCSCPHRRPWHREDDYSKDYAQGL